MKYLISALFRLSALTYRWAMRLSNFSCRGLWEIKLFKGTSRRVMKVFKVFLRLKWKEFKNMGKSIPFITGSIIGIIMNYFIIRFELYIFSCIMLFAGSALLILFILDLFRDNWQEAKRIVEEER